MILITTFKHCKTLITYPTVNYSIIRSFQHQYDLVVIGGGITGAAIAKTLIESPEEKKLTKIALLEKENAVAKHQSSHNSGVIHAGIYYKPGSLKSQMCTQGLTKIYKYADEKNIPYKKYGKLIVATTPLDVIQLKNLYKRGVENQVPGLELLDTWKEIQPNCRGMQAIWSPETGNIDWKVVTEKLVEDYRKMGGLVLLEHEAKEIKEGPCSTFPIQIATSGQNTVIEAKQVVLALGLQSGTLSDSHKVTKTISFRVNYGLLSPTMSRFIKTNIYGMPNVGIPFLGTHISPTCDPDKILLGPSAVPALKLEGYEKSDFDACYAQSVASYQGFHFMVMKNLKTSLDQFMINTQHSLACDLKRFFPMISSVDVAPGPSAVQAQIIDENGDFCDDFIITSGDCGIDKFVVDCRFIPSPGATSCLAVAEKVSQKLLEITSA